MLPPIETIPDEILTLILESACLCHDDDSIHRFRDLLLAVSRKWREIVLRTPSFWSVLQLSPSNDILIYIDTHLERSKQYPLDICMRCYWRPKITKAIFDRITPHSERWRRLVIQTPTSDIFSHLENVPGPSLETIEIYNFSREASQSSQPTLLMSNLSRLSSLSLQNMSLGSKVPFMPQLRKLEIRASTTWNSYFELCEVLGRSPALENLTLHLKPINIFEHALSRPAPISLPALHYCQIITSEGLSYNISSLMRQLYCPNIICMTVQDIGPMAEREILMRFDGSSTDPSAGTVTWDALQCQRNPSKLYVRSSDPYLAWSALTPRPSLTVLELRAPRWPTHHRLEELCSGLMSLETLVLREFQTSSALQDIGVGPAVAIPSLQTLDIEFQHTRRSEDHHVSQFFRIFSLRNLRSLRLRDLLAREWENLLCSSYYPSLRSLSLLDMRDFISSTANPVTTFPFITDLHLSNVRSNDFVRRLVQSRPICDGWSKLQNMTIVGDDLISKPLLHKVVAVRSEMGLRISNLVLEEQHVNEESRNWLNRHCGVNYVPSQNVEHC